MALMGRRGAHAVPSFVHHTTTSNTKLYIPFLRRVPRWGFPKCIFRPRWAKGSFSSYGTASREPPSGETFGNRKREGNRQWRKIEAKRLRGRGKQLDFTHHSIFQCPQRPLRTLSHCWSHRWRRPRRGASHPQSSRPLSSQPFSQILP